MTFTAALAPELPFLRRYARAITGSSTLGDAAVRTMLEALLEAPEAFNTDRPARLELYRIFHHLWAEPTRQLSIVGAPTATLDARSRQALMLTAVEGFNVAEASLILGDHEASVAENVKKAREAIAELLISDVLVIEDEAIIALHIRMIVKELGHNVVGVARTHREAVELARTTNPELILADISLADGSSGVDAVRDILTESDVPVIFITAFPERLLTGERMEPTYLITKPFEPEVLVATIGQALMFHREGHNTNVEAA